MNQVIIGGRLARDVELRYTSGGKGYCFGVIVADRWNSFKKEKETAFINFKAWGKLAEVIAQNIKKGSKMMAVGHIDTGKYEKDGKTVYTQDVILDELA